MSNPDNVVNSEINGYSRREFIKNSVLGGISVFILPSAYSSLNNYGGKGKYRLKLDSPGRWFDGESCRVHPRAGIVPGAGERGKPRVVMTMNSLDLSGSDVFRGVYGMETDDLGRRWTEQGLLETLAPRYEIIEGVRRPVALSDFWPSWHKKSGRLLGTGHTVVYTPDWKVTSPRPRHTSYSVYDPDRKEWAVWQKLQMPGGEKFIDSGAGCVQRYENPDGTILLPLYFRYPGAGRISTVIVSRCEFDGQNLRYLEHGNEMSTDIPRGFGEPSITFYRGRYFLTLRNDQKGYVTEGRDGLNFNKPVPWKFDDGEDLGNYNTQQHWVTHSDALFLVYTRRGANNDHVTRHRAPLFMAQVDHERLCVLRDTEEILIPERGARLGNFGVTEISENETWVTVSEWMQPEGVEKYGSDGSVFIARLKWKKPNRLFHS